MGKKNNLFLFFLGKKTLPENFYVEYLCYLLKITYTELEKQPYNWVNKMVEIIYAKNKAEEFNLKKQEKKLKTKKGYKKV